VPKYKNRPRMKRNTELRRYFGLNALVATLSNRQLRFTRIDQFADPFEGSVPKQQIDDQVVLFSGANFMQMTAVASHYPGMERPRYRDMWTEMTARRRAMTRSIHACCWIAGPESEGMWRLYCDEGGVQGRGVALRTTLARIETSVRPHDLYVSPVTYRHYHEGPAFNDEMDPFMHKRKGFAHEHELRLLKYNEPQYIALAAAIHGSEYGPAPVAPPDLATHIYLAWSPLDHIEAITISPYGDDDYENQVREAVASIDPELAARVELSILCPRRYAPGF
jgi:hypothetical protein